MMNCREAKPLLAMLASGELESAERRELEAHIENCPDCRRELESLKQVMELIAIPEKAPERSSAPQLVVSALSGFSAPRLVPYRVVAWAAAAVVVVALLLGLGIQAKIENGTLVLAIGRSFSLSTDAIAAEDAYAISQEVVSKNLDEEIAPSFLALRTVMDSIAARQSEEFAAALAQLDEKWQERMTQLSMDIADARWSTMNHIFTTNRVVNEQTEWLEALLASADLEDFGLKEGEVK